MLLSLFHLAKIDFTKNPKEVYEENERINEQIDHQLVLNGLRKQFALFYGFRPC
jgi:hypothetical protein